MAKPVRVTISGPDDERIDAPTVDDLLGQIRDFVEVLKSVEKTLGPNEAGEIEWRVTDATMNSPISLEFTPYGKGGAAAVASHVDRIEQITASGLRALRRGDARPPFFSDETLVRAKRLHARVLNGLSDTVIAFDATIDTEALVIDRPAARDVERTIDRARAKSSAPYREIGSIEGFVTKPELDGYNRAILRFKSRLSGEEVKAYASGDAFRQIEALTLSDVWHGLRVRVYGTITYKSLGVVEVINATGIEVLDDEALPGIDAIIDPNFTGGISTEDFLRELRRDD